MNRPFGILFHTLKGTPGWSFLKLSKLDIARIFSVNYHKRPFMIVDRDKPFTLEINYYLPKTNTTVSPTITTKGQFGATFHEETQLRHYIAKRYESEKDVKSEIQSIQSKQDKLDEYCKQLSQKILGDIQDE